MKESKILDYLERKDETIEAKLVRMSNFLQVTCNSSYDDMFQPLKSILNQSKLSKKVIISILELVGTHDFN
jgi:hypothetical protein